MSLSREIVISGIVKVSDILPEMVVSRMMARSRRRAAAPCVPDLRFSLQVLQLDIDLERKGGIIDVPIKKYLNRFDKYM